MTEERHGENSVEMMIESRRQNPDGLDLAPQPT